MFPPALPRAAPREEREFVRVWPEPAVVGIYAVLIDTGLI